MGLDVVKALRSLREFGGLLAADPLLLILLASLLALMLCSSCGAPADDAARDAVVAQWETIAADGTISAGEAASFARTLSEAFSSATSTDWPTLLAGLAGSALSAFLGVNLWRNRRERRLWGAPLAPDQIQGVIDALTPEQMAKVAAAARAFRPAEVKP